MPALHAPGARGAHIANTPVQIARRGHPSDADILTQLAQDHCRAAYFGPAARLRWLKTRLWQARPALRGVAADRSLCRQKRIV